MAGLGKYLTLCLVVLLVVTSTTQLTVNAQTIPKPVIPNFTVKLISEPYTITTTNPYTGESTSQQYINKTIKIAIYNQKYSYSNGSVFYVYLNVRTRGHFEQDWQELYPKIGLLPNVNAFQHKDYWNYYLQYIAFTPWDTDNARLGLPQSDTKFTTLYLPAPTSKGEIDFQVEAMIGHNSTFYDPSNDMFYEPTGGGTTQPAIMFDASSGWSNIQTIDIGETASTSPTPNPTPTVPELSWLAIVPLLLSLFAVALLVRQRKASYG